MIRLLSVLVLLFVAPACAYRNPHGTQALPPVIRIVTIPMNARVVFQRINLQVYAPADILKSQVSPKDEIIITKDGYQTFQGRLEELPMIAADTYQLEMVKN